MNVVCEPECRGEGTGIGDGGGQDAAGRRCPVVQDSATPASLSSCLSQALGMPNRCTGDFYTASGSFPCPLGHVLLPTDQHWHSMDGTKDQWMVLCFLILAVRLWIFPKTVIWNKIQAALRSVQWHCFFPTKQLQRISRKTDITPHQLYFIILQFQCKPVHKFFCLLDEAYPILISFNQNKKYIARYPKKIYRLNILVCSHQNNCKEDFVSSLGSFLLAYAYRNLSVLSELGLIYHQAQELFPIGISHTNVWSWQAQLQQARSCLLL